MINWTEQINRTTEDFVKDFGTLTAEQLNWKPNANTWSIAQNIDHLIVINETYFPILADLKAGTYKRPFMAKLSFMVSFLGKIVLNAVQADRIKKMKTFPIWEPTTSEISSDIIDRFVKHQTALQQQIVAADYLVKNGTVIASPANKNIVYTLQTAFDIIVTHEQRHFAQAKEVLEMLKNNT